MIRAQILLKKETHEKLKREAKRKKTSVSGEIRDMLQERFAEKTGKENYFNTLLKHAESKKGPKAGIKDLSTNDDYLYKLP